MNTITIIFCKMGDFMRRIDEVYKILNELCARDYKKSGNVTGFSAADISKILNIQRTNASSDLNRLCRENKAEKMYGKPVLYKVKDIKMETLNDFRVQDDVFGDVIGYNLSLKNAVQQAKAAIIYPPNGLHTLILGETGTGKSMFAETMYKYAKEIGKIRPNSPFVTFNCSDYANNPQLLMSQIFGVKKGAYTGANADRLGLVEKANEGILFLDEVHRLPAEGQEMLFYLIDKGIYRRLGESDETHKANVLIVCATTENVESILLKTFTRRIPMIIRLPALKDRSIEERFELIRNFFMAEANCIKSDIMITSNALKALILYNCSNNIGQLKSDIKLCCSKAFLENMMKRDKNICIHSQDLPQYVLSGLFKYKERRDEVDRFIDRDFIKFCLDESNVRDDEDLKISDFYEALEEKRRILESKGISETDIKLIMSLDIDTYFKKYILNIDKENLEELYKVVDKEIVGLVNEFLCTAGRELQVQFNSKILYGLSMHIASSIERILKGKKIENHQLEDIKRLYSLEFEIAQKLKIKLEEKFHIIVPEDETGFITMFLCMDRESAEKDEGIEVIVAMHGESAATSIADVANRLLGENYAIGYNMPLDQKPETALENLIEIINGIHKCKGVLLLVDMGSLVLFGDMIFERTGVPVKTIEMVSTPIVLEATRKALLKASLEEVYDYCVNMSPHVGRIYRESLNVNSNLKKNVIITACVTGEGTALKLKSILEKNLGSMNNDLDILNIDTLNNNKFNKNISNIKLEKNILAVVSAVRPEDKSLLYISTSDIFDKEKLLTFISNLDIIKTIYNMKEVIAENVNIDSKRFIESFRSFYVTLLHNGIEINSTVLVGLILHIACAIERIINGEYLEYRENNKRIVSENPEKYRFIKKSLQPVEDAFNITVSENEYSNIIKIVYSL